ncbi:MAG: glycine cleavage system aminomethyltransferase GcvT [Firmicutes bacterium]|nr:glycine cleavage system aminomethyltransferase GcvT [Bacillota bacterium]
MSEWNKTCLYDFHEELKAKMEPFAGFLMPIVYEGIQQEHLAVRHDVGMFDVSHMGEIIVSGKDAIAFVEYIFSNEITSKPYGKVVYGLMLYENGTIVDDLLVYKVNKEECFLVVNASNVAKDYAWIVEQTSSFEVLIKNVSDEFSQIALQGPNAETKALEVLGLDLSFLEFYTFQSTIYQGFPLIVSRTGYTGEDGFEFYGNHDVCKIIWQKLFEHGVVPCGLGARDTLRFEAALPLYGHEISDQITPLEAGLKMFVKLEKPNFIGKKALELQLLQGLKRRVVGLELSEMSIPRQGYLIFKDDIQIGVVTTGYLSISLNKPIAMALIDIEYSKIGTEVFVQIRKKLIKGIIRDKKFLKKNYKPKGENV